MVSGRSHVGRPNVNACLVCGSADVIRNFASIFGHASQARPVHDRGLEDPRPKPPTTPRYPKPQTLNPICQDIPVCLVLGVCDASEECVLF